MDAELRERADELLRHLLWWRLEEYHETVDTPLSLQEEKREESI